MNVIIVVCGALRMIFLNLVTLLVSGFADSMDFDDAVPKTVASHSLQMLVRACQ